MLRETRKYIEKNFTRERTIPNSLAYKLVVFGYWKLFINLTYNTISYVIGDKFETYIIQSHSKDRELAVKILRLYNYFFKKYSPDFYGKRIKPKELKLNELKDIVNKYKEFEYNFSKEIKIILNEDRLNKINNDF